VGYTSTLFQKKKTTNEIGEPISFQIEKKSPRT